MVALPCMVRISSDAIFRGSHRLTLLYDIGEGKMKAISSRQTGRIVVDRQNRQKKHYSQILHFLFTFIVVDCSLFVYIPDQFEFHFRIPFECRFGCVWQQPKTVLPLAFTYDFGCFHR